MLKWNTTAAKVIVTFSLITLFAIAATEAVMLALVLHHSSEADQPETARQPQMASAEQSSIPSIPPEAFVFHGSGPLGAVHVPFRLNNGAIEVTARINGKPMECVVDTGSPRVSWVSWLHLTNQRTGLQAFIGDGGNHVYPTQEAILECIQLGSLELHHIPSDAVAAGPQSPNYPTLGNNAFAHLVLTIDYAEQELIIQPSVPNAVPAGVQDQTHGLSFRWLNPDARGEAGVPCVRGTVMAQPANITIDTGWLRGIGITNSFYYQLRPQIKARSIKTHKETINAAFGTTSATAINHISWSLDGITRLSPASAFQTISPGAQAVMSPRLLKDFRTTIDYPQQKIWFDPIQPASKPTTPAKQGTPAS